MLTATRSSNESNLQFTTGDLKDCLRRSKEIVMWKKEHFNHYHKAQGRPTSAQPKSELTI